MKSVDSDNIVSFKEIYYDTEYICIVMEYITGGDLAAKMKADGGFFDE
jgi:serine/threonine protein kinase